MSPVEYLETRVAVLRAETPSTPEACLARDAAVHELLNCLFVFQLQAVQALHLAQLEAGIKC